MALKVGLEMNPGRCFEVQKYFFFSENYTLLLEVGTFLRSPTRTP